MQGEHDFSHFCAFSKNVDSGHTWEVRPLKFGGFGNSVFVFYRGGREFLRGVGTRVGAVLSFSILLCSMDPINFRYKIHEISTLGAKCYLDAVKSFPEMKIRTVRDHKIILLKAFLDDM